MVLELMQVLIMALVVVEALVQLALMELQPAVAQVALVLLLHLSMRLEFLLELANFQVATFILLEAVVVLVIKPTLVLAVLVVVVLEVLEHLEEAALRTLVAVEVEPSRLPHTKAVTAAQVSS